MAFLAEELADEAQRAIAAMRIEAIAARAAHARAELMRHLMLGAAKLRDRPREDAIAQGLEEWLAAWKIDHRTADHVARMRTLVAACHDAARAPNDAADRAVRAAFAALEADYAAAGTSLADAMAWRSGCAHGWWADVAPLPGKQAKPFWDKGCPAHCL